MNNATTKVQLPYRLSFDRPNHYKPGRGEAGWTVGQFASLTAAKAFMKAHPEAEMPCWRRF